MGDGRGSYTSMYSGANLWDTIFMYSVMGLLILFMFLRMIGLPFTGTEGLIWSLGVFTYAVAFAYARFYAREKHRQICRGVKFLWSTVWRDHDYRESFLFGVKEYSVIPLELDNKTLMQIFNTNYFRQVMQQIKSNERYKNIYSQPTTDDMLEKYRENIEKSRRKVDKSIIDVDNLPEDDDVVFGSADAFGDMEDDENGMEEEDFDRELNEDITRSLTVVEEREKEGNIQLTREEILNKALLPFEEFSFEDVDLDIVRNYNLYSATLYEGDYYADQIHGQQFDKLVIVMRGRWEELMQTRLSSGNHEGYPVDIDQVECSFIHLGWAMPNIPILLLAWSENMKDEQLNEVMDSLSINYLEMQVLRRIVTNWRSSYQKYELELNQWISICEMLQKSHDELLQRIQTFPIERIKGHTELQNEVRQQQYMHNTNNYKKIIYVLIVLILIVIIVFVAIGMVLLMI